MEPSIKTMSSFGAQLFLDVINCQRRIITHVIMAGAQIQPFHWKSASNQNYSLHSCQDLGSLAVILMGDFDVFIKILPKVKGHSALRKHQSDENRATNTRARIDLHPPRRYWVRTDMMFL